MPTDVAMISAILRRLAAAIDSGDRSVIAKLYACTTEQRDATRPTGKVSKIDLKRRMDEIQKSDPSDLHDTFSSFENRDALEGYILDTYPTKAHVVTVARKLRVHITKMDDFSAVINKVIDATLGYRLRQQAIRGDSDA